MRILVSAIRNNTFLRHNAILFVGAMGIGLLNYLCYPILARILPPDSFGEVQALFSLFAQITIFLNVLSLLTVNIVANYDDVARRNRIILELEKLALLISICLLIGTLVAGHALQKFFKFGDAAPFGILAGAVVVSVPFTFRTAYLRGYKRFGLVSLTGIVAAAADLVIAVLFVLAGWGTTGAIAGLVVAQLLGFGYASLLARRQGFSESLATSFFRLPDLKLIVPELKYAALVLTGSLVITGLYSSDAIAVKHYFDAQTAGLYAGITTVARIIFFLTASIAQVLLPSIKLANSPAQNHRVLFRSFILLTALGGLATLTFSLAPHLVIHVLMGAKYLPYAHLLPRLSLLLFVISVLNLFVIYGMALRRYALVFIMIIGSLITFILLQVNHRTLQSVIDSLLYGSISILILLGIQTGWQRLRSR